jgi:LuxR family maltose regulon positive regulatory protein
LLERLGLESPGRIVSVVAPAGFGKTTLLAQWADRDERPFAWVSLDEMDNDPKVLLTYVVEALNAVEPLDRRVYVALASVASSVPGSVVPRLSAAFASMRTPVVLVLDDVHLVRDAQGRAALSVLADHVPPGSLLVLSGRSSPPVRVARLRAEGRIMEIGPADLALTMTEAGALLRSAGVTLADEDVVALWARTEGWPAGLYLAALSLRELGSSEANAAWFGGEDRFVSEYVDSEFLERIPGDQRLFLTRTSVLERMSGTLCDAVLETTGSGDVLRNLVDSNLLLVPLDRRGLWFRYHHLLRDMLRAELERGEPDRASDLRRRAAAWHEQHGEAEEAMEYSIQAEDADSVARLLKELWGPVYIQGRTATLRRWFRWLDERGQIERIPVNAINAAFLAEITGEPGDAERWAEKVDRWHRQAPRPPADAFTEALAATLRAMLCRDGAEQMRSDADEAARWFDEADYPTAVTPLLQGTARILCGELDRADEFFARAEAKERQAPDIVAITQCERALVSIARHRWVEAQSFAEQARAAIAQGGRDDTYASGYASAVVARVAHHRGDLVTTRRELTNALRLRGLLTYAHPHWAVQCRVALIRLHLALMDPTGARTVMGEVEDILRRRPDLGKLGDEIEDLRATLASDRRTTTSGVSALTAAELRVLPFLSTHLTYQEIADELVLSKHTIHAQTRSLFRKLGATSRSEAVALSRALALLE